MPAPLRERLAHAWDTLLGRYQTPLRVDGETALADPYRLWGGRDSFRVYNPAKLVTAKGLYIFDEMRRDDQVKASLAFKKKAVLASGWELCPAKGGGADDEATGFVRESFQQIEGTLESSLIQVLSALDYGFSVTEKVYEERNGRIRLKALKTKRPHPFTFIIDGFGNLEGIHQAGNELPLLPPEKFLIYRHQYEFGNPYGTSDLDAAYRPWWNKDNAYKWLSMLLEKYGIPPIFALYNQDAYKGQQLERLKTVLERIQASTVAVVPRNSKDQLELWSPELAGQVSQAFKPAMDMMNQDIARAILMPGFLGVTPDTQGSYARARVIFDMFMFTVEYLRKDLANAINESVVPQLVALNFTSDPPLFKFKPLTRDEKIALLETWLKMVQSGVVKATRDDEVHVRERLDFPERLEGDDEVGPVAGAAEPVPGALPPEGALQTDVAATGLNGAQITAAQAIVQSVADGQLPHETARELLLIAFPFLNERQVDALISALINFIPRPEVQPMPSAQQPKPPEGQETVE